MLGQVDSQIKVDVFIQVMIIEEKVSFVIGYCMWKIYQIDCFGFCFIVMIDGIYGVWYFIL